MRNRWPCLWALCNVLASRQKKEPPDTLLGNDNQAKFFPAFSSAELLKEPLLARMGGLQLKSEPSEVLALPYISLLLQHLLAWDQDAGSNGAGLIALVL